MENNCFKVSKASPTLWASISKAYPSLVLQDLFTLEGNIILNFCYHAELIFVHSHIIVKHKIDVQSAYLAIQLLFLVKI